MSQPFVYIPKPCLVSQQALAPTEAGWHCARCQTEVIDFTGLSETEVLAYLAARPGQRVCAAIQVPAVPWHPKRPKGLRRLLLAITAFLGWQSASALPPLPPSQLLPLTSANRHTRIVISGVVLDDSLNTPLRNAYVFIEGTEYGAVTNERGEFSLSFASNWELAKTGELVLTVSAGHVYFERKQVVVSFKNNPTPAPLTIRLLPVLSRRNFVKGKTRLIPPPVAPPASGKN
ncbi:MAG: carboxypeptidase-like regulatory domain-containing protein [Janthinobacterium lividum]